MKLKNAVIGQVVQIKDIHDYPTDGDSRTCYALGVNIEEHEGVILFEPDSDGDVCVQFNDGFKHITAPEQYYLYVHHTKLRKVK